MATIKEQVRDQIEKLENKVNAMTARERVILMATVIVVFYFIWNVLVFDYFLTMSEEITKNSKVIQDQITLLASQVDSLSQMVGRDPTGLLMKRQKELKQDNSIMQDKIEKQTKVMISPKDMVKIVKNILEETGGLSLLSLKNIGTKPLFTNTKDRNYPIQVFSHGIVLEVNGNYFDTLRFLEAAEQLPYKMIWDNLVYVVEEYPAAKIKISISTLGLEESFIGV